MKGWFRELSLADDGRHLVVGYVGGNLLALDAGLDEVMIRFFDAGKPIGDVRLGGLIRSKDDLRRTASHYLWASSMGLDSAGYYVVKMADGRAIAFDVSTGKAVTLKERIP